MSALTFNLEIGYLYLFLAPCETCSTCLVSSTCVWCERRELSLGVGQESEVGFLALLPAAA